MLHYNIRRDITYFPKVAVIFRLQIHVEDMVWGAKIISVPLAVVNIVRTRSKSFLRVKIAVISDTLILLTSYESISMIRSPGETLSAKGLCVRTLDTTIPLVCVLFTKIMPSFPAGATTVRFTGLVMEFFERDSVIFPSTSSLPRQIRPQTAFVDDLHILLPSKTFAIHRLRFFWMGSGDGRGG